MEQTTGVPSVVGYGTSGSSRPGGHYVQWRHNGRDSVSNHQPHDCLLNRLFKRRTKKTSVKHCKTRGHRLKLPKDWAETTIKAHSFTHRVVNDWNSLPGQVISAPSVNAFKNKLDAHWMDHPWIYDWEAVLGPSTSTPSYNRIHEDVAEDLITGASRARDQNSLTYYHWFISKPPYMEKIYVYKTQCTYHR